MERTFEAWNGKKYRLKRVCDDRWEYKATNHLSYFIEPGTVGGFKWQLVAVRTSHRGNFMEETKKIKTMILATGATISQVIGDIELQENYRKEREQHEK